MAKLILNEKIDELNFHADTELKEVVLHFTDADGDAVEAKMEAFLDKLPTLMQGLTNDAADAILTGLKRKWTAESRQQQRELNGFRKRLAERWGNGLELLKMLVTISREYGSELNSELRPLGGGNTYYV